MTEFIGTEVPGHHIGATAEGLDGQSGEPGEPALGSGTLTCECGWEHTEAFGDGYGLLRGMQLLADAGRDHLVDVTRAELHRPR